MSSAFSLVAAISSVPAFHYRPSEPSKTMQIGFSVPSTRSGEGAKT